MSTVELTGPRLSSLAYGCARQCFYQAKGASAKPPTTQMLRWFRRGHAVSDALRNEIVEELRVDGQAPRRELSIPWPQKDPVGTGHADLYVPRDKRVVEITSTAGASLAPHKAKQVAAYAMNLPRAEEAYVLAIDPSTWREEWWPVDWEALAPEIRDLEQQLVSALRQDEAPTRCCKSPRDAETYRCSYADVCFADWEEPELAELLDPETVDLVAMLAQADETVRNADRVAKEFKAERDELRNQIRSSIPAGEQVRAGDVLVKRTVSQQERFSLAKALAAGHSLPEDLSAFVSESEVERWTIKEAM